MAKSDLTLFGIPARYSPFSIIKIRSFTVSLTVTYILEQLWEIKTLHKSNILELNKMQE